MVDESSVHFSDFADVTHSFVDGYTRIVRLGVPEQVVGLAMLGATINLYNLFEMNEELPAILRSLADRIEAGDPTH